MYWCIYKTYQINNCSIALLLS